MDTRNRPDLEASLEGELYYLNRAGFQGQIAPLMRHREGRTQVLVFTSLETLRRFRSSLKADAEVVGLAPNDWRERGEFLEAIARQGGFELIFDGEYTFRTGQAMLAVEAQKTLTACLS